jgi:hypothetical protein
MRVFLKTFLLFALIFSVAYVARILTVPEIVPIADAEESSWQVQIAFALTSVQNVGLFGMILIILLALVNWFRHLVKR